MLFENCGVSRDRSSFLVASFLILPEAPTHLMLETVIHVSTLTCFWGLLFGTLMVKSLSHKRKWLHYRLTLWLTLRQDSSVNFSIFSTVTFVFMFESVEVWIQKCLTRIKLPSQCSTTRCVSDFTELSSSLWLHLSQRQSVYQLSFISQRSLLPRALLHSLINFFTVTDIF